MATKKATTKKAATKKAPVKKAASKAEGAKLTVVTEADPDVKAAIAAAKKPAKKLKPIEDLMEQLEEDGEEIGEGGKIRAILMLWIKGYSRKDIIAAGYNKSTVYRQVGEYEKLKKAPAISYQGYQIFEGRVQAIMSAKKCSREKALQIIQGKDLQD